MKAYQCGYLIEHVRTVEHVIRALLNVQRAPSVDPSELPASPQRAPSEPPARPQRDPSETLRPQRNPSKISGRYQWGLR